MGQMKSSRLLNAPHLQSMENPYQPPADLSAHDPFMANPSLLWRKGRILVMRKNALLPARCIKK